MQTHLGASALLAVTLIETETLTKYEIKISKVEITCRCGSFKYVRCGGPWTLQKKEVIQCMFPEMRLIGEMVHVKTSSDQSLLKRFNEGFPFMNDIGLNRSLR